MSLYNETMGAGIPPTPAIGGVGLVADVAKTMTPAFKAAGQDIIIVGGVPGWLGRTAWLATVAGREEGAPPPVDLAAERRNGEFVASLIAKGRVTPFRICRTAGLRSRSPKWRLPAGSAPRSRLRRRTHAFFFGEDQGRYALTAAPAETAGIVEAAGQAGVPVSRIGVTGGDTLKLGRAAPIRLTFLRGPTRLAAQPYEPSRGGERMIPFLVVKTRTGLAYLRPERIVAVSATDSADCMVLMTDGVTIAAREPAEDVVARLEAEASQADEAERSKEQNRNGHVPNRD